MERNRRPDGTGPDQGAGRVDHSGGPGRRPTDILHIDCDSCVVRGPAACGDCVVTVLLGAPPQGVDLDTDEQAALSALADSGLVPPLRLVPGARRGESVQSPIDWQDYA